MKKKNILWKKNIYKKKKLYSFKINLLLYVIANKKIAKKKKKN